LDERVSESLTSDAARRVFASKHECSPAASTLGRALIARVEQLERERDEAVRKYAEASGVSTDPIPPEDVARAAEYVRERGWVGDDYLALEARTLAAEGREKQLRDALAAYRSAIRSGEPETEQLRTFGDEALASVSAEEPSERANG
jgi:hypothetical protein